jgi:hydroxymethylbilane synthase
VLATLEGGCAAPIGVLAEVVEGEHDEELWVRAAALSPDGTLAVRMSATGDPADAAGVGIRLGEQMLDEGAGQLTETPAAQPITPHEQPVTDCERQEA